MADLRGGGGDDSGDAGRRWRQWSDAYYTADDDYIDNPEMWMRRAKKMVMSALEKCFSGEHFL